MAGIQGLTSAAHNALGGLSTVVAEVEDVAKTVAAGLAPPGNDRGATLAEVAGAISRLPLLSRDARANAKVLETINDLASELLRQPRR